MRFWRRKASLAIGAKKYELGRFNFSFVVKAEDNEKLPTAEIEILNLSAETRASLRKGDRVILNAGYEGDVGAIFVGEIAAVQINKGDVDITAKIAASAAVTEWTQRSVSKTYMPGMSASGMLGDLLNIFGLEVSELSLKVDKQYPRGKVCAGKLKDVLREIIVDDCESRLMIKNGMVLVNPPDAAFDSGYRLTPGNGLIKSKSGKTEQLVATGLDAAQGAKDGGAPAIQRECLLNHHLAINEKCVIRDHEIDGVFRITRIQHKGSWSGDYITSIEAVPA
jgi:hypothetical protein